jgi:hypothetical protein
MNLMRYRDAERNQLANCMLLTREENGAGGKGDLPPDQWFVGPRAETSYLEKHLIPPDRALWKLDRFDDFIAARKKLIAERFKTLLVPAGLQQSSEIARTATLRASPSKRLASLIEARALSEGEPLVLNYKGRMFSGEVTKSGIKVEEGVFSPSEAAIQCYARTGSSRPTENGWRVWKTNKGITLNDLLLSIGDTEETEDEAALG